MAVGGEQELDWTFSQQVVGNAYTLIAIGFLIACAVAYFRFLPQPAMPSQPSTRRVSPAYHQRSST